MSGEFTPVLSVHVGLPGRQQAAQKALGRPTVRNAGGTAQRATARPTNRVPTVGSHNVGSRAVLPKTGVAKAAAFNPMQGFMNTQQLGNLANEITKQNMSAQLEPLRQQAGEIKGIEGTVANRYGNYSNATDQLLQGIGQNAESSAKTAENAAADSALKAGQGVNLTGSIASSQAGNYLAPGVQSELNAQGERAGGVGGAANSFAANAGQNETNFMGNLRAAAAQRSIEGQKSIANTYGADLAKNSAAQQSLIAKQPAVAKSLAAELGQKQFTDYATLQGLGIKNATAQQGQEKINLTAKQDEATNKLKALGLNITAQNDKEKNSLSGQKIAETERHNRVNEAISASRAQAYVKEALAKANGGLTTTEQDKVSGQIGTAYSVAAELHNANIQPSQIRQVLTLGRANTKVKLASGAETTKSISYPKISNQEFITAALELYNSHKVSTQTAQALKGLGFPVPAEWTNGSFKGF